MYVICYFVWPGLFDFRQFVFFVKLIVCLIEVCFMQRIVFEWWIKVLGIQFLHLGI